MNSMKNSKNTNQVRKQKLGQCFSLGDMMAHIEDCKKLDMKLKRKHKCKTNDGP